MDDVLKGKIFQNPQEEPGDKPVQSNPASSAGFEPPKETPPSKPESSDSSVNPQMPVSETATSSAEPAFSPTSEFKGAYSFPSPEPISVQHINSNDDSASARISQSSESVPVQQTSSHDGSAPRFSTINIVKLLIGFFSVLVIAFVVFTLIMPNLGKKEQKVELTFWDIPDSLNIPAVLSDFEKQNPNIKVNYQKQESKDYKERLITRSRNGNGPDIFRFHNTWVIQLPNLLLPIPSDVISKDNFNKTFYPVVKHDLVKNGAIYGVPIEIDTLSLFVNTTMIKQASISAPTNWNDFITSSRTLTLKDQNGKIKIAGASLGTFDNVTHAPDIISMLLAQDSVNLDDISKTKTRISDALNFYTGFALSDGSVWSADLDPSIIAFSKGNLAMYFGYLRDSNSIKSANPNLSYDILNVPYLTGQTQTIASYYPLGVSLKSKHQKEALLLLKFLERKDIAAKLTSLPSARMDVTDKTKGAAKNAVSSYFAGETFDNGLNSQLNSHLGNAVNSIISGNASDSATDDLILGFSQVLNQFVPKP